MLDRDEFETDRVLVYLLMMFQLKRLHH